MARPRWELSRRRSRQAAATAFHVTNARERAQKSLMAGAKPMSSNGEQVANLAVNTIRDIVRGQLPPSTSCLI
jgi:hypothetical protein